MKKRMHQCFLCLCLAFLMLASSLVLPAGATGGTINVAHPGVVFGEPGNFTYNSKKDTLDFQYTIYQDPQDELEELADILVGYGMTLEKNKKSFFGGNRTMELSLGDDLVTCVWDKRDKRLTVSCDTDLRLEWMQDDAEVYCWYEEEYPADYLKSQITLMQETYGLNYEGSKDLPGGGSSVLLGPDGEIRFDWYEREHLCIATYRNGWFVAGTPATESTTEPQNSTGTSSDPSTLPSFLEFDEGDQFTLSHMDKADHYCTIVYVADDAGAVTVAREYIQMMRSQCGVVAEKSKDKNDWYLEKVLLDHPCDVTAQRLEAVDFYDYVGDVFLKVNQYRDSDSVSFSITYVNGLNIADSGSASIGSGGGGSLFGEDCSWCGGDGRCNDCGGDGRVSNWVAGTTEYVEQNCLNCHGGSCRHCGGSGKK